MSNRYIVMTKSVHHASVVKDQQTGQFVAGPATREQAEAIAELANRGNVLPEAMLFLHEAARKQLRRDWDNDCLYVKRYARKYRLGFYARTGKCRRQYTMHTGARARRS